jgi:hypothetical protein
MRVIKSRRIKAGACSAPVWKMRNTYKILVEKPEGKRPLGRPRRRWEDNIKMNLREIRFGCGLDSSGSGREPVVDSCEHGNEPSVSINDEELLDKLSGY